MLTVTIRKIKASRAQHLFSDVEKKKEESMGRVDSGRLKLVSVP